MGREMAFQDTDQGARDTIQGYRVWFLLLDKGWPPCAAYALRTRRTNSVFTNVPFKSARTFT